MKSEPWHRPRPVLQSFFTGTHNFTRSVRLLLSFCRRFPLTVYSAAVFILTAALYLWGGSTVTICVDGNPVQTLHTFGRTVEEALSEADLELQAHDLVSPAPGSHLMTGMTINIARAFPVTVTADSSVTEIWTTPVTVAELLEREGFQLGPWDRTEPAEDTFLTARAEINLIRVEKVYSTRKSVIPYGEIQRGNAALDRGMSRGISGGANGLLEELVEITYENGVEVARKVVQRTVLQEPQHRIVERGENTTLERGGRVLKFQRALYVTATAYCPGTPGSGCPVDKRGCSACTGANPSGRTRTGVPAVQGQGTLQSPRIVAVDPRVIPLKSMLYIEGFGFARAEDTGGAIKGNRIDILFDKHADVVGFGVKRGIKVYILTGY